MNAKRLKTRSARSGLTLMEVLLVLAILVILGAVVFVSLRGLFEGSKQDIARTQIRAFETQLDAYMLHVGSYPTSQQGLNALRYPPPDLANPQKWRGPYAEKAIPPDPWDRAYQYMLDVDEFGQPKPRIWSLGADGQDQGGLPDDISNVPIQQ